ncbi:MAG: DUF389 domain-containing protein [Rubrivivax sp.]|nr:DUF389 domain-containing protein [Rubrivivax sp.]
MDPTAASTPPPQPPPSPQPPPPPAVRRPLPLYRTLVRALNLRRGLDHPEEIDADIRRGVEAVGTNLWVLMFAILIASVGLNVNSTAVIIGAMLISPLMGPIVGIGYALAIRDFELIRVALRNLAIFTGISLATSTLYFSLSPLEVPGSELLARTSPTLWDVLIAFFGGAAGIIALTRHNVSTVVPGVAIATALMPPLCTAGFALSQGRWDWLGGALYLYAINSVFIAWATLLFVKLMKLRTPPEVSRSSIARGRWLATATLVAFVLPSGYLAWRLVSAQSYTAQARQVILELAAEAGATVLGSDIDAERREIVLTVVGDGRPGELADRVQQRLQRTGFPQTAVVVRSASGQPLDVGGITREIKGEIRGEFAQLVQQSETLRGELEHLQRAQQAQAALAADLQRLRAELLAQHPALGPVSVGVQAVPAGAGAEPVVLVADWRRVPAPDQQRLRQWLVVRLEGRAFALAQALPGPRR